MNEVGKVRERERERERESYVGLERRKEKERSKERERERERVSSVPDIESDSSFPRAPFAMSVDLTW